MQNPFTKNSFNLVNEPRNDKKIEVNLYLHIVFDAWTGRHVRAKFAFERYADDIVVIHTGSESAAKFILKRIGERFAQCGLELHPRETKLVRTESHRLGIQDKTYVQSFDFLGHQSKKCRLQAKGSMKLFYTARIDRRCCRG